MGQRYARNRSGAKAGSNAGKRFPVREAGERAALQEVQQPGWLLEAIHRPQPVKRPGRGEHPGGEAVVRDLQVQRALERVRTVGWSWPPARN